MPASCQLPVVTSDSPALTESDYQSLMQTDDALRFPSRRRLLKALASVASVMALPKDKARRLASRFLNEAVRVPVIWLEFQDCTGDTESFIRAAQRQDPLQPTVTDPGIVDLLLDVVSVEYHETLMTAAGFRAELCREQIMTRYAGQYLVIIEGSIPIGANGAYCTIGGRSALSIAQSVCANARAIMTVGSCSANGGLPCANPNPSTAKSVLEAMPEYGSKLINIPGCPANVVNMVSSIVYLVSFGTWPTLDALKRPTFAYSVKVHDRCFRKGREEAKLFGDAKYLNGGCLKEIGCRGPDTYANCPTVKWNGGVCWPIQSGHGCISCTTSKFWDTKLSPTKPLFRANP